MKPAPQRYNIASSALGHRVSVHVFVYATQQAMADAGTQFNGEHFTDRTQGITNALVDEDGRATQIIVRLHTHYLTYEVISHEMAHAAHALYGASLPDREPARTHIHHHNERLAHLHTDLFSGLLRELGNR